MARVRTGTVADAALVTSQRRAMFLEMWGCNEASLEEMCGAFQPWVEKMMARGEYLAWFALGEDAEVLAGAGLWVMDWPPNMFGQNYRRGHLLNVYTLPEHRRQGLGRLLVGRAVDWCKAQEMRTVVLHASDAGRALYEALGFVGTNEMRLMI